jgi:hypothetical protein
MGKSGRDLRVHCEAIDADAILYQQRGRGSNNFSATPTLQRQCAFSLALDQLLLLIPSSH